MTVRQKIILLIAFTTAAALAILLGACSGQPLQPQPCATWLHPDGVTWMEEDNEPIDDDPCDRNIDLHKPSKAPAVKLPSGRPSPVKPAPVRTTRKK